MTETLHKLRSTVAELEAELAALENVDDQTRAILEQAARDILTVVERGLPGDSAGESTAESTLERLRTATHEFGQTYPTLTGILGRLINGLGQMGI